MTGLCGWVVAHQMGSVDPVTSLVSRRLLLTRPGTALAVGLLLTLAFAHQCFPGLRRHTQKFFALSYYDPQTEEYGLGTDDVYMVVFWILLFTALRAAAISYVLIPFAAWAGIKRRKGQVRFAEQAWVFLYAATFFSLGMVRWISSFFLLLSRMQWEALADGSVTDWVGWGNYSTSYTVRITG